MSKSRVQTQDEALKLENHTISMYKNECTFCVRVYMCTHVNVHIWGGEHKLM